jgi:proteasome accessory factor A
MSEYATFLKVGTASIILTMLEDPGVVLRDLTLENPIRAIREISHDVTCRRRVRLASGREMSALDIQSEYLERALRYRDSRGLNATQDRALDMWEHCMKGLESDPLSLVRECDWVTKYHLIEQVQRRHEVSLSHPKISATDLLYHDINQERGLYYKFQRHDRVDRIVTDADIKQATSEPPQTTRARLRGAFVRRAKERRRDFTVDWVHLKLNDQAQRTVLLKDPFRSHEDRVERLIASL